MKRITTPAEMRSLVAAWRADRQRIGLVPTMGFLHEGHLSLVDLAATRADRVVVSIYVNPTQFAPGEDLAAYPRDLEGDEARCRDRGVAAVFYPSDAMMYAPDHSTWVVEDSLSGPLCGRSRPTHFRGVTTVVTKLFHIVQPEVAVFGQKDAQQVLVIQRMVRDLDFPVEILVGPIVREADGLAMSSRNRYLSGKERQTALCLQHGLLAARRLHEQGERQASVLVAAVAGAIRRAGAQIDYVELVSRNTLQPLTVADGPCLLAGAIRVGRTRLIDNLFLGSDLE